MRRFARPRFTLWLTPILGLLLGSGSVAPAPAEATARATPVAIGDLDSVDQAPGAANALRNALRKALTKELESRRTVQLTVPARARFVMWGSVSRVERRGRPATWVRAEVRLMLAERRHGTVRALLTGRAKAAGGADPQTLERSAVAAAVRGALKPLDDQLRLMR